MCGDFRDIEPAGGPFDALVGRLVLLYQADPAAAVRSAARHLRPGGVVAFAEINLLHGSGLPTRALVSWPRTHASEKLSEWLYEGFARLGTQPDMGTRLPETFVQAGLQPSPDLEAQVAVLVGEDGISRGVELVRSLLPTILDAGIATEEEVDIDTLAERLHAGTGPAGRVMCWPTVIGAYATKPPEA